ncbi:MAG: DUF3489 domain-containing protein [Rhodoplanes sp.]
MTKISDTQRAILIAAARREDGAIRSARVKGGAAAKTIQSLIKAGLITDKPFTITADGRAAIGARAAGTLRTDTKQAQVVAMLRGADGATVDEIAAATGWQRHTVRGAIAGALKKKLSLDVISEKIEGRGRVYRIAA